MILKDKRGYTKVFYEGELKWKHRVIWFEAYGYWPDVIDHIDGNKSNNDLSNLREVTKGQNNHYRNARKDSSTGIKGVLPNGSGYMARISKNGKKHYLGTFPTKEEAEKVYLDKAEELYGDALKREYS